MKALYSSINQPEILIPVAKKLRDDHDIHPVYWSGAQAIAPTLKDEFPELLFHDFMVASKGEWPDEIDLDIGYRKFSQALFEQYRELERLYYEVCMTRADPGDGFKYYELTNYYHKALAAALSLIETHKPDVWISSLPPHAAYDNVLYEACRQNGVQTIILYDTNLPGYMLAMDNIDYSMEPLKAEVKRLLDTNADTSAEALPEAVRTYVLGMRESYEEGKPFQFKINYPGDSGLDRHRFSRVEAEVKARKSTRLKDLLKHYLRYGRARVTSNRIHYIKQHDLRWKDSYRDEGTWLRYRKRVVDDIEISFQSYKSLCQSFDTNNRFVFFPLHLQPECTTVPQGGLFSDQLMILRMFRSVLDKDVHIYIKEAPWQFRWHRGPSARYAWFYEEVAAMDNVRFLPMDTDPFELIDHSECVLCITGTAGWESVVRGKPVIAMGSLYYYKGFTGVYQAQSSQDMADALEHIRENPRLQWDVTLRDIHALINISHYCTHQLKHLELHKFVPEENVQTLANAIMAWLSDR